MTKLEVVARAAEDQQHEMDGEGVCLHGEKVFTGADDGKVKVWDHHNLKLIQEFQAHDYAVTDLLVMGDTLFTCSSDATIKSWDANTCQAKNPAVGAHEEAVRKMTSNGTSLFAGDENGDIKEYGADGSSKAVYNLVEEVWGLLVVGDVLYSVRDRGVTISQLKGESNMMAVMAHVEGRAPLVIAGDNLVCPNMAGMNLIVRENITPFKVRGELKGHEMIITAAAGHGQRVASTGYDNLVRLWDLSATKELASCELPGCANALAFSEDGCIFATGTGGYVCKLKAT